MSEAAWNFAKYLDENDFDSLEKILDKNCRYLINDEVLTGPAEISNSYRENYIKGSAKFDKLEWGESKIEKLENSTYVIHFSDHLMHNGLQHTYRCDQKVNVNSIGLISQIEHIELDGEREKIEAFFRKVGLE